MNKQLTTGQKVAFGFVWLTMIFVVWTLYSQMRSETASVTPSPAEVTDKHSNIEAYTQAQEILKKYLKAPASADFPTMRNASIEALQDDGFKISSYVDAQNSFGANLRQNWSVVFQYAGDHVEVYAVVLNGEAVFKREGLE